MTQAGGDSHLSSEGEAGVPPAIVTGSRVLCALVLSIGALGLAGWTLDLPWLDGLAAGLARMKANAALCFLLVGLGLFLVPFHSVSNGKRRFIARLAAALALAIGMLTLTEYLFQWDLGIDQLFFRDTQPVLLNLLPGRMAMGAAAGFTLAGAALLLMCAPRAFRWRPRALAACGSLVALLGLFSPLGYSAADPLLVGWWRATPMALHTAGGLALIGGAILLFAWQEARARWTAERTVMLGFGFTILILAFLNVSGYLNDYDLIAASGAAQHSQQALNKIQDVLRDVVDAQGAARGYVISGDESFGDSYRKASQALMPDLKALQELSVDSPEQQRRISLLEPLLSQRIAQFDAQMSLRRDKPADSANPKALVLQGEDTSGQIRVAIAGIQQAEERLLAQRRSVVQAAGRKAFYVEPLGDLLSYLAIIVGMVILLGHMAQRRRMEAELRASEERLRLATEAGEIGTYEMDFATGRMRLGPVLCRILGLPPGTELRREDTFSLIHSEDRERAIREFSASRDPASGGAMHVEFRMLRSDGEVRWVVVRGRNLFRETNAGRVAFRGIGAVLDITERKQAEEALRQAKQEWERTFDSVPDLIAILDEQHRIVRANRAMAERLGLTPAQCVGQICYACVHGKDKPPENCPHVRTSADHQPHSVELREERLGGDFLVSTAPLLDDQGHPLGIVHVAHDITERKRAEAELRASEERYRGLFENMTNGFAHCRMVFDEQRRPVDFIYLDVNSAFCSLTGLENAVGKRASELFPGSMGETPMPQLLETYARVSLTGKPERFEIDFKPIGKWLSISVYSPAPEHFVAVFDDITVRKRAEEALREAHQKSAWLARFPEEDPNPVGRVSSDGIVLYRNPAAAKLPGWQCEVGDPLPPKLLHLVGQAVEQGHDVQAELQLDGRIYNVSVTALNEQCYANFYGRDISELKRAEEEHRAIQAQLLHSQKLESLGVLAGGIAHDFNNLLMVILGNAEVALLEMAQNTTAAGERIVQIRKASQRAAELCQQMLAYAGKAHFVVGRLNLNRVLNEMGELLEISISKKVVLEYKLAGQLPPVEADATQMRQVAMNLITNASEAIGDRSGVITISTGVAHCDRAYLREAVGAEEAAEGLYVFLEVSDTGAGIAEDIRARIFDPFFSTKFTGRGLGLAGVLGIVRGHKGAIRVHSEPGHGTSLRVLLPAAAGESAPEPVLAGRSTELQRAGLVLLVDDEEPIRAVVKVILEKAGFQVLTANDGREAVGIFKRHADEITCVLLDLLMPHMDGEEAYSELRRIRANVPVVLSSGYDQQEAIRRFAGKDLAGFIQKPYRQSDLLDALRRATLRTQKTEDRIQNTEG